MSNELTTESKMQFLKEYVQLCRKHNMALQSCYDCESIWIQEFAHDDVIKYEGDFVGIGIQTKERLLEEFNDSAKYWTVIEG